MTDSIGPEDSISQFPDSDTRGLNALYQPYFELSDVGSVQKAKCKLCPRQKPTYYQLGEGSISNIRRHLKRNHKQAWNQLTGQALPKNRQFLSITSSGPIAPPFTTTTLRNAITLYCVEEDIAFFKSKSRSFVALMQLLKPGVTSFSPDTIRRNILRWQKQSQPAIVSMLRIANSRVSLTMDGWTAPNGLPMLGLTLHYITLDFVPQGIVIALSDPETCHTGKNMAGWLLDKLETYEIKNNIWCITMDNASANTSLSRVLSATPKSTSFDWPESRQIRCVAHILNLVAKVVVACCEDRTGMPKSYTGFEKLLDDIEAPGEIEDIFFFDEASEEKEVRISIEAALQIPVDITIGEALRRSQRNGNQTAAMVLYSEQNSYRKRRRRSIEPTEEQDLDEDLNDEQAVNSFINETESVMLLEEPQDQYTLPSGNPKVIRNLRQILKAIKGSVEKRRLLQFHTGKDKAIVLDVETRWNSTLYMLNRSLELQDSLDKVVTGDKALSKFMLSSTDWEQLREIQQLLSVFEPLTLIVSDEETMISMCHPIIWGAIRGIKAFQPQFQPTYIAKRSAIVKLAEYWNICQSEVYFMGTLLDPRNKADFYRQLCEERLIDEEVTKAAIAYTRRHFDMYKSRLKVVEVIPNPEKISLLFAKRRRIQSSGDELDCYLDKETVNMDTNVFKWWSEYGKTNPNSALYAMARDVFSAQISSVASERLFSSAKLLISEKRNRLDSEIIEATSTLKSWSKSGLLDSSNMPEF